MELEQMGKLAKEASRSLLKLSQPVKNACLVTVARNLVENTDTILEANEKDIENGRKNNMPESLLDRLKLTRERIDGIAEGVRQVAALEDPIGEVLSMKERPNGLMIGKKRVPLGVIGMIYESRPNVTVDAFSLCFKLRCHLFQYCFCKYYQTVLRGESCYTGCGISVGGCQQGNGNTHDEAK